ncbi:MAG: methyltransferase domain-containing protein [Melioribacteraceae bacterium]
MDDRKKIDHFWKIRSAKYDNLFWTKDDSYLKDIFEAADLNKNQFVLDVGTGTGTVAKGMKDFVRQVVAVDISDSMLEKGLWNGISVVNWDIGEKLFAEAIFDRVVARMIFHHILDNLDRAILRCYDLLKEGGKIVVAEGIPPSEDPEIIDWYTEMFKHKEERRTFTESQLKYYLEKNGFKNVKIKRHIMNNFSINNWVENSGLDEKVQKTIIDIHLNAPQKVKDAYEMRVENGECLVKTENLILTGEK